MFFDYVLLSAFILSAILIAISSTIHQLVSTQLRSPQKKYHEIQKKVKLYQKLLYFFILSGFVARMMFAVSFPIQLDSISIFSGQVNASVLFLLYQALVVAIFLLFIFLVWLYQQLRLEFKFIYFLKVLKFILSFNIIELIISSVAYLYLTKTMMFRMELVKTGPIQMPNKSIIFAVLIVLVLLIFTYILLQRKRTGLLYSFFTMALLVSCSLSLMLAHSNIYYYFDKIDLFKPFTASSSYYGWLWILLVLVIVSGQIITGIMINLKNRFTNRYFAINYTMQLNRVVLLAVIGLNLNALFPQLMILIFNG